MTDDCSLSLSLKHQLCFFLTLSTLCLLQIYRFHCLNLLGSCCSWSILYCSVPEWQQWCTVSLELEWWCTVVNNSSNSSGIQSVLSCSFLMIAWVLLSEGPISNGLKLYFNLDRHPQSQVVHPAYPNYFRQHRWALNPREQIFLGVSYAFNQSRNITNRAGWTMDLVVHW